MIIAFFGGKCAGEIAYGISSGVWHGYTKGLVLSICVYVSEIGLVSVFVLRGGSDVVFEAAGVTLVTSLLFSVFSMLVGLILYTAPSFFGYGIGKQNYVAELLAKEADKAREEIERDLKIKQNAKPHLD